MRLTLVSLLLALVCVQQASGLFFYLKEGQKKCFLEDLPRDTMVIVNVQSEDLNEGEVIPGQTENLTRRKNAEVPIGIKGVIQLGNTVIVENTIGENGRFAFTAQDPGEHSICLQTNSTRWFGAGAIVYIYLLFKFYFVLILKYIILESSC